MELKVRAVAGTLESSDIYVVMEPGASGIELELKSTVADQYGDDIRKVVDETLNEMGVKAAKITLDDKGALDVVIKSRLQTAIMRAAQSKEFKWE
ncbi:citrate lyase acyl carrier protein [Leptotrichia sp. OH3620_COT-345]|uniref:citrate lyase acyl carrier protein n=1 Tax=Leptotrichia sp. OH3620_COT-345 TaxID=2491048 RepID=UPI000F64A2A8|nr:citrate lyase acyl carrier protein [Leptotrichia sp. OH3620_COT-345]RRD40686.1 citrate lyase acyl carrier protein [Leptotrichia sp. OH3620_COT-345]